MDTTPQNASGQNQEIAPLAKRLYPDALAEKEAELIKARRRKNDPTRNADSNANAREIVSRSVGLALSGGGIRSATFCLGVTQQLARFGFLRHFDILSTVSGGGYVGSFVGKLIQERGGVEGAEDELKDDQSWSVRWLRENGYYLAPGGSADSWVILALLLRNWMAVQFVLGGVLIIPFLCSATVRRILWNCPSWSRFEFCVLSSPQAHISLSPWFIFLALSAVFGLALPAVLYWFTQIWPRDERGRDAIQNTLTHWAGFGLLLMAIFGLVTAMDTAGSWLHFMALNSRHAWSIAVLYGAFGAGFGILQKAAGTLTKLTRKSTGFLSSSTLAGLGGFLWAALFWLALAFLSQFILLWGNQHPNHPSDLQALGGDWWQLGLLTLLYTAAVLLMARVYGFVNLSSLHQYYSSRLCRAYLGASNKDREQAIIPITQSHPSDDLFWDKYRPHLAGGPIHILNCTLNETISGKSQIIEIDRKGLPFALGPSGLTVSGEHHALWSGNATVNGHRRPLTPIANRKSFKVFQSEGNAPILVENLTLGDWIGISGAAFSTGMGANTSTGLSLLLGFANIRLGYWWNSGIDPKDRESSPGVKGFLPPTANPIAVVQNPTGAQRTPRADQLLSGFLARLFPAPSSLLDELLTQFHGPARQRWYLSDGGHFENTACYELLRRRVGFILCIDCGQDELYTFEDLANLIRKARIDFDAEIEFIGREDLREGLPFLPPPFNCLNPDYVGLPKSFTSLAERKGRDPLISGPTHALLARVFYDRSSNPAAQESDAATHILFLKPSLSGDESADIAQYHSSHPAFPQESTVDQFFNESQWESYRALGQHVATKLFAPPRSPSLPVEAPQSTSKPKRKPKA